MERWTSEWGTMPLQRAAIFTDVHRIEGSIAVRERLADALNDRMTEFLELVDVVIEPATQPGVRLAEWAQAVIPKKTIQVAALDISEHESNTTRIAKLVPKSGRQMGVVVGDLTVYGTGHLTTSSGPSQVLRTELVAFFPVTEAMIVYPGPDRPQVDTKVALINRDAIRAFTAV